jgi:hypothetical protein
VFLAHTSGAFAALRIDGSVVTWGKAESAGDSSAAQQLLVSVETIVGNLYAFAAITTTGSVVAWGRPNEGGLIPADLLTTLSSGVTEVFSTNRAFAALKGATGELVLWGNPYHGGDAGAAAAYLTSGVRTVCGVRQRRGVHGVPAGRARGGVGTQYLRGPPGTTERGSTGFNRYRSLLVRQ